MSTDIWERSKRNNLCLLIYNHKKWFLCQSLSICFKNRRSEIKMDKEDKNKGNFQAQIKTIKNQKIFVYKSIFGVGFRSPSSGPKNATLLISSKYTGGLLKIHLFSWKGGVTKCCVITRSGFAGLAVSN